MLSMARGGKAAASLARVSTASTACRAPARGLPQLVRAQLVQCRPRVAAPAGVLRRVTSSVPKSRIEAAEAANATAKYATPLQWAHWAVGGGVLLCFGTVYAANGTQAAQAKAALMSYHSQVGLAVLVGVGARVFYRATTAMPPPIPGALWEKVAAKGAHLALYPLMLAIPLTGVMMGYFGGGGLPFLGLRIP